MKCDIVNCSDQTICNSCKANWDINDRCPPECPMKYSYNVTFYNKVTAKRHLKGADFTTAQKFVADLLVNGWRIINIKKI